MQLASPKLSATLNELKEQIDTIRSQGDRIGEENTKALIIDPLLSALGWNLRSFREIKREYRHTSRDNPVDYALFIHGSPRLFVEAKDLDAHLNDRRWISQVLGYATVVGVKWCVLTNGDEYRIYNSHAAVGVEQKLFRSVKVSDCTKEDYVLSTLDLLSKDKMVAGLINSLWKIHFVDQQVKRAAGNLFANKDDDLVDLIQRKNNQLHHSDIVESLGRMHVRLDFADITSRVPEPTTSIPTLPRRRLAPASQIQVIDLIKAGLIKPPLELEKPRKGVHLRATIQPDGSVVQNGISYGSLSEAGKAATGTSVNGWISWKYTGPSTGQLMPVDSLRQQYLNSQGKGLR